MGTTDGGRRHPKPSSIAIEPAAMQIPEACSFSGLSRSEIYRRLADGSIQARKSGSRTLILTESLRAHLASLPPATFRAPQQAA